MGVPIDDQLIIRCCVLHSILPGILTRIMETNPKRDLKPYNVYTSYVPFDWLYYQDGGALFSWKMQMLIWNS